MENASEYMKMLQFVKLILLGVSSVGSRIYKCKDWRIIQLAQLKPIAKPVKVIKDGLSETPKKNPNIWYFLKAVRTPYPVIFEINNVLATWVINLSAILKS